MKAFFKAINVPTVPSSSCFFLFFLSCALDMTFPQHCVAPQGADQGVDHDISSICYSASADRA